MSTRDQRLGGGFGTCVGLDKVGTETVLLLALTLLNQHNTHHKPGFLLTGQDLLHNAQLLLGFHVLPDPLPLFLAVTNGPLPDGSIVQDLELELKLLHQPNGVAKHQSSLKR